MTPSEFERVEQAAERLRAAGIDNPLREARWIMESARAENIPGKFDGMIARRAAREPLQHILGDVEFCGLDLLCDARALIPRSDSETVAQAALDCLPEVFSGVVADLGTGSGCLLLAVLASRLQARGIGVDASAAAVSLARENAERTGLSSRASFVESSWGDWDGWSACDLIISNPPYIRSDVIGSLQPEVRDYDPLEALDGGTDGLDAYRSIFTCAEKMRKGAHLVLEIGYDQGESVPKIALNHGFQLKELRKDPGGNARALIFVRTSTV